MNEEVVKNKKGLFSSFDSTAFVVLFLGILLTPIIVFPFFNFSIDIGKKYFLLATVVVSLICWTLGRVKTGKLSVPKNYILLSGFSICVAFFLSALAAANPRNALIGFGFESGTFISLLGFVTLMFLTSIYFQSKKRFLNFYLGLFLVFAVAFVFQFLHLVVGNFTPWWTIFNSGSVNLIGKWNEFGIFAGFIALSGLLTVEFLPFRELKLVKYLIWTVLVASLLVVALVNFYYLWVVLAIFSFVIYAYYVSFNTSQNGRKKYFRPSLVILVITLFFVLFGRSVPFAEQSGVKEPFLARQVRMASEKLQISSLEIRPSILGTWQIAENALKKHLILGVGPNNFLSQWLLYKPTGVNSTNFWNVELNNGFGYLPTFLVTTGLLGLLTILVFLGLIINYGIKSIFSSRQDSMDKSFLLLSFAGLVYLWTFAIIYVPDTPILTLAFALTGLFIARLADSGAHGNLEVAIAGNAKAKFASSLTGAVMLAGEVAVAYILMVNFYSVVLYTESAAASQAGKPDQAENYIERAISLNPQDLYYRTAVEINLAQMGAVVSSKMSQDQLMAAYAKVFERAKSNADSAIQLDGANYSNYMSRGSIYENILVLGVKGSYDLAEQNYLKALDYNPQNPAIYISLAQTEIYNKNLSGALDYLSKALALKKDYLDAIFLQSQIYAQGGDLAMAIKRTEYAALLAPDDTGVAFQLGYLKFRNNDYRGAITTLGDLVAKIPNYSNAKYFLGLSYSKTGEQQNAIKQFTEIKALNPDNAEVGKILDNLQAGRDPLADSQPISQKTKPPVNQK